VRFTSVAIFRTQLWGSARFETHMGGKLKIEQQNDSASALHSRRILTHQGNCTTACKGNTVLHTCPTSRPCHFGRPHPSCVLAALPAHSTLVWSSLLLLQLLLIYALASRKASSGMQRTCSGSVIALLGTYMTELYVVLLATTHSAHFYLRTPSPGL